MLYLVVKDRNSQRHRLREGQEIDGAEFEEGEAETLVADGVLEELEEWDPGEEIGFGPPDAAADEEES